jgi:signal transduction histidine kinase
MKDSQSQTSEGPPWHQRSLVIFLFGCAVLVSLTFVCFQLRALASVASLLYMVVIVLISLQGRLIPAVLVSLAAVVCLDYFFIEPVFRLAVAESLDVVALAAYVTTAVVITWLLSRVQKTVKELRSSEARLRRTNDELRLEVSERRQAQEALRLSEQQRLAQLARANEALRECLDTLTRVPELDDFLGQVMAVIARQLGSVFSTLRMLDLEQNRLTVELVFRDDRVLSPEEAEFPESWRSRSPDEQNFAAFLTQAITVTHLLDPHSPTPEGLGNYLLGIGMRSGLIIRLSSREQAHGLFAVYFNQDRHFEPEELEITRALATQASLAIQLTRLAKAARQSAVLEERNQLAGEIHDSLAQFFTGISMQLGAAEEVFKAGSDNILSYLERASDLAQFGLSEARRSAFSLQPSLIEESGLIETLQKLVERSNIPGRLRCNFHSAGVPEESLPSSVQQDLLRIAQEAMSNAVRHAKPTVITVNLRCDSPDIVLEVIDNGSGISDSQAASREGFGFSNMRARAANIGAQLNVRTASGRGTTIVVNLPVNF